MRIASFTPFPGTESVDCFSDAPLGAFDAVFADLQGALGAWLESGVWQSKADQVLSADAHAALVAALERRSKELRRFVDEGKPVVLFPAVLPALKYVDRKGRWSDAGDLGGAWPAAAAPLPAVGPIEFRGTPEVARFAEPLAPHFLVNAVLPRPLGTPWCLASGKAAGAFLNDGKRWVLTCPRLAAPAWESLAGAFAALYRETSSEHRLPALPAWHDRYLIPGEAQMAGLLKEIEKAIAEVHALREAKLAEKEVLGYLKRLFTDEGPSLRRAAEKALEGMGFGVQPGSPGGEDFVITLGVTPAIVLARGRGKAASEADAVELDKAVQRYIKAHDVIPKGILLVNGFRDLPLHERGEPVFPAAMLGYAKNRGQCLVTGLQLLCLFFEARAQEQNGARVRAELLNAAGPFPRYAGNEWETIFKPK